jgi:hypothetical protein
MGWRAVEMVLGLWIAASRALLPVPAEAAGSRVHDVAWGACVILFAFAACFPRGRVASLGVAAAAIEIVLLGRFGEPHPRSFVAQSYILTGLLLLMICPIPTRLRRAEPDEALATATARSPVPRM